MRQNTKQTVKQIAVLSGKGGTGKTSITAAFSILLKDRALTADCDVDASNMSILLEGNDYHEEPFFAGQRAVVTAENCTGCGICEAVCRYDAIRVKNGIAEVNNFNCEGCNACSVVCPEGAIGFKQNRSGTLYQRNTDYGELVHAALGIAQDNSGKLVSTVKERAKEISKAKNLNLIILDGPPGIGCPVHATLTGISLVVAVTEPSMAGHHDLERLYSVCAHFKIPCVVIINKYDLSIEKSEEIEKFAENKNILVVGKIPFDKDIPRLQSKALTPLELPEIKDILKKSLDKILSTAGSI
ncbi:MAG: ATP-binding protein [Deltaproteobacteria bacterium]|nr:ATP-binding protein [Deltaproteobacteria bacterium]